MVIVYVAMARNPTLRPAMGKKSPKLGAKTKATEQNEAKSTDVDEAKNRFASFFSDFARHPHKALHCFFCVTITVATSKTRLIAFEARKDLTCQQKRNGRKNCQISSLRE